MSEGTFTRDQRFSTDWHANTFAGATVRQIMRGMGVILTSSRFLLRPEREFSGFVRPYTSLGWMTPAEYAAAAAQKAADERRILTLRVVEKPGDL